MGNLLFVGPENKICKIKFLQFSWLDKDIKLKKLCNSPSFLLITFDMFCKKIGLTDQRT
jgi:hypothetical protein